MQTDGESLTTERGESGTERGVSRPYSEGPSDWPPPSDWGLI